jgi:two-component system LytT family sensor kinase
MHDESNAKNIFLPCITDNYRLLLQNHNSMKIPYHLKPFSLWKTRLLFPPLFHILADSIGWLLAPSLYDAWFSDFFFWTQYVPQFLLATLGMYIISESNFWTYYFLNKILPWERNSIKRLSFQLVFALVFTIIASIIIRPILFLVHEKTDSPTIDNLVVLTTAITILLSVIFLGIFVFQRMRESLIETEELKRENLVAQNQALRQQVDPHFLFNGLNTLTILIAEDKELAIDFVRRLSKVYRYVLQSKELDLIDLKTELEFVQDYVFAFKMRFGEHFQINIEIPDNCLSLKIPPLTLQILVENAVKHNVISKEHPLHIHIGTEGNSLAVVRNTLQPKPATISPTHIGLNNILTRYRFVSEGIVEVLEGEKEFIVKLPLIKT